ncbi:unnamed protein product, partial [Onchocerca flexuosa]|uniref:JmjC domain-containing protein n=1 Tax=Onchocerca flexuosa TaxID=387005 RepID=A0A183HHX8_9BILA
MEKKKTRKNRKKNSVSNVRKEKENVNSKGNYSRIGNRNQNATGGNIEVEAKQDGNEMKDETKLSEEFDAMHSVLTNNYADDNDDKKCLVIEETKLHQEKDSCSEISNDIVENDEDGGNFSQERRNSKGSNQNIEENSPEKIQETNLDKNNSELNLNKMYDEAKDDKASEIKNSAGSEEKDFEKNNLSDAHEISESPISHDVQAAEQNSMEYAQISEAQISELPNTQVLKPDFLSHQDLDSSYEKSAEKDENLNSIGNKVEIDTIEKVFKQMNSSNIQDSKIGIETDTEVSDFTVSNQNLDLERSILTEIIEQLELQEIEEQNRNRKEFGKKGFEATSHGANLSESGMCITESQQEIDMPCISDEVVKSVEDPVVLNEVVEEKLKFTDNSIQKLSSTEIPKERNGLINSTESAIITLQQNSIKESQAVENLPANESKISCDAELLKDSEKSNNDEIAQPKNKFYEALTGFWKYTGFSKKRADTTTSSEQPRYLSSELKQIPSVHSSKTSLTSTESSTELVKSPEASGESITKVDVSHSEANVTSSLLDNTAIISPQKTLFEDQSSQNLLNTTITENLDSDTISESLQGITPDSLTITDETIKDSNDDSPEKMGDSKKSKKGKTESIFGHK